MKAARRSLLGSVAALAAVPVVPASAGAAAPNPDATLLEACAQYMAREAEWNASFEKQCAAEEAEDKAEADRQHHVQVEAASAQHAPLNVVINTPALTPAGKVAKAEVAMTLVQTNLAGEALSAEDALLWSLAEDLAGKPLEPHP
ncbi:MAG TPA: hypothetical protein VIL69_13845 [Roseomonas sp.]|jgi:hypothetical protein